MRKLTTIMLAALPALLMLHACDKGSETGVPDKEGPVITIYEPDSNDVYMLGDTIFLLADVEDDSELKDFNVKLINGADSILIWPLEIVIFGNIKSYHLDQFTVNTYNITAAADIVFEAIDKKDNITTVTIPILLEN